jgi:threonyl-tRNA synthetase
MSHGHDSQLQQLRHSAAHLLAHALLTHFPQTQLTIGPATTDGFFYDVLPERNFKEEDLALLETTMHELSLKNYPITHEQMPKEQARLLWKNNKFKLELINDIPGDTVGIARQGEFYDLCKGGHVEATGDIKFFRLTGISGSYWRADKSNQALQRIHGVAFFTQEELDAYEQRKQELQMYDHRRLGKQLDLFSFHQEGVGFPFFHPKGKLILLTLTHYLRQLLVKHGYLEIETPTMLSDELWKQSGHYDHYKQNMYFCIVEEQSYAIKPMNCPGAILVYKERPRSFRELPLRLAEFGLVHRHELSGVLHGLFRVRAFTIDDGHIFCPSDKIEEEVLSTITLIKQVLAQFGFDRLTIAVSTKPDNAMGDDILWQQATDALTHALERAGLSYTICEGEGAFYGPKIEVRIQDSMGREWQCSTIQLDFFQPERFDLSYIASSGTRVRPVMIHRAIYGSLERFLAILIEHYKGNFPFWLAPLQIRVLSITDAQKEYAATIAQRFNRLGFRCEVEESSDPLAGKIKSAQLDKIPWMLIVGRNEVANNTVTLRTREGGQEANIPIESLLERAQQLLP